MTSLSLLTPGATTPDDDVPVPVTAFDAAAYALAWDFTAGTFKRVRVGPATGLLIETPAGYRLPVVPPSALRVVNAGAAAWTAGQALNTHKTVAITTPTVEAGSGKFLHVFVYNPSASSTLVLKVQDLIGANAYDRQTYSGATSVTINPNTRASFLLDGGVGPGGSQFDLVNQTATDAAIINAVVDAWQI